MPIEFANETMLLWALKLFGVLAAVIAYRILKMLWLRTVEHIAYFRGMRPQRVAAARRAFNVLGRAVLVVTIALIISIQFHGLTILLGTIATAIGIAFFAQWSVLSNVTAGLIIFWRHPLLIGDDVQVIGVDGCRGVVRDFTLFYIILADEFGNTITIPNNLLLAQPTAITQRSSPESPEEFDTAEIEPT